jgi:chorismate synthase
VPRLRLLTAGESHGPGLVAILEGLPHGLELEREDIDRDLARRQRGYGRGGRMKIEHDRVEVLAGLRNGHTTGAPLALLVRNLDFAAWATVMDPFDAPEADSRPLTRPRPGHADLAGALKLGLHDARDVLERSSARSTAARVAAGAVCRRLLASLGIETLAHVVRIGGVVAPPIEAKGEADTALKEARARAEQSEMRCADPLASDKMREEVRAAQGAGDALGGVVEVIAWGLPPGLGSHVEWDLRLDGRLAQAVMSIQAIKSVEIGLGLESAALRGSEVHDPIAWKSGHFERATNRAGGIEGGNTNGEPVVLRAAMKPIPTLARPLASIDLATKEGFDAQKERTDTCAVPAAAVVAEAAVCFVLCDALLDKTGGDTMAEVAAALSSYRGSLAAY